MAARRNGHGNGRNHGGERQRSERLWDVAQPANNDTAPAQSTDATASATPPSEPEIAVTAKAASAEPAATAAAEPAPVRRRHEQDSSEPRIERVVVRPDQPAATEDDSSAQPQRKGWWQRTFGGD